MRLFWRINTYISVTIFILFTLNFFAGYFGLFIPDFLAEICSIIFIFFPFLELIQIPICLIVVLATLKNQKKIVWLYFLMMTVFFIIKISVYFLLLGSIIPLNNK
jgi:hypothetical protein